MLCGSCSYIDGYCYTSHPPKVRCNITGEYRYYGEECNCEDAIANREAELEQIKKLISEPVVAVNTEAAAEAVTTSKLISWYDMPADITVGSTPCIVCGEDILLHYGASGPKVCSACKKAIQFIKERFKGDYES